jgi:hypothetical protein
VTISEVRCCKSLTLYARIQKVFGVAPFELIPPPDPRMLYIMSHLNLRKTLSLGKKWSVGVGLSGDRVGIPASAFEPSVGRVVGGVEAGIAASTLRICGRLNRRTENERSFAKHLKRRGCCVSNAAENLLEKINTYMLNAEMPNAQARSLTSLPLEEALDPEESTSAHAYELTAFSPTGGQVYGDDTSLEEPLLKMAAKCHEAVSYAAQTDVKQLSKERGSRKSLDDTPNLVDETRGYLEQHLEERDPHVSSVFDSNLAQDSVNNLEEKSVVRDFVGCEDYQDEDEYEYLTASSLPFRNTVGGVPPKKKSKRTTIESTDDENPQKKSRWQLDYSKAIKPTKDDVLCGRGGHANTHPGNICIRKKALELLPEYNISSHKYKKHITVRLVNTVTESKHRFLKKGQDGEWYRVLNPMKKASQLFRDAAPSPNKANQDKSEESEVASPRLMDVGWQDINLISKTSEEFKNEYPFDHQAADFLYETILIDELPTCQPHCINDRLVIDMACPLEHTKDDVLFGRDDKIKLHPGNIRFRQKAKELLERYNRCSNENKEIVALELVDSVISEGNFFLAKGPGEKWYHVVGDAPRKKASQIFRDIRNPRLKEHKQVRGR